MTTEPPQGLPTGANPSGAPTYSLAMSDDEVARYRAMATMARQSEAERWASAGIVPGAEVLDLGCGPGVMTMELASIVGPSGSVIGVDREEDALEQALALLAAAGVSNASVQRGVAWDTDLEPSSFDVVNMRHVLAHNTAEGQERILSHVRDLLRPGGCLYTVDVDLVGARTDPPDEVVDEMNVRYLTHLRDAGRDPSAGVTLASRAAAAGLEVDQKWSEEISPPPEAYHQARPPAWAAREAMVASGHARPDDIARWESALDRFARSAVAGEVTFSVPQFTVIARRPITSE